MAAAILKLQPLVMDFDTVGVSTSTTPPDRSRRVSASTRRSFAISTTSPIIRSFDHVFANGSRRLRDSSTSFGSTVARSGKATSTGSCNGFRSSRDLRTWHRASRTTGNTDTDTRDHVISGRLDAPANGLTFYDAWAYCGAAGGRLPTGDEWIAAAVGPEGRRYPWGDDFTSAPWPYLDPASQRDAAVR